MHRHFGLTLYSPPDNRQKAVNEAVNSILILFMLLIF